MGKLLIGMTWTIDKCLQSYGNPEFLLGSGTLATGFNDPETLSLQTWLMTFNPKRIKGDTQKLQSLQQQQQKHHPIEEENKDSHILSTSLRPPLAPPPPTSQGRHLVYGPHQISPSSSSGKSIKSPPSLGIRDENSSHHQKQQ